MAKRRSSSHHSSHHDSSHHTSSHYNDSSHHDEGGAKVIQTSDNDPAEEQAKVQPKPASCWDRFKAEINPFQSWFLKTHPAHDRPLDIKTAFAPEGIQPLFFKVSCGGFVWATAIFSLVRDREDRGFWFAYMSHWMLLTGSVYFMMSVYHTLFGASQPYKRVSSPVLKFTWLLFSFTSHFGFLTGLFFWLFVFEKGVTSLNWETICTHTITPFTIFFDGTNVNRIPLRWQHYIGFVIPMEILYVFWTWIQNDVAEIENPNLPANATEAHDDAIYEAYNWKEKGTDPLIFTAVGIFCIGPCIWFLEWMFSQYWLFCCCWGDRRLYYTDPRKNKPNRGHVEGAGLSHMRRMSFDEDDVYSGDDEEERQSRDEEEKLEDEPQNFMSKKKPPTGPEELSARG